jgi:hypothetical protein
MKNVFLVNTAAAALIFGLSGSSYGMKINLDDLNPGFNSPVCKIRDYQHLAIHLNDNGIELKSTEAPGKEASKEVIAAYNDQLKNKGGMNMVIGGKCISEQGGARASYNDTFWQSGGIINIDSQNLLSIKNSIGIAPKDVMLSASQIDVSNFFVKTPTRLIMKSPDKESWLQEIVFEATEKDDIPISFALHGSISFSTPSTNGMPFCVFGANKVTFNINVPSKSK